MTQFSFPVIDATSDDGEELASWLNQWKEAVLSFHSGSTRPTYVVPGMLWVDTSAGTTWKLKKVIDATNAALDAVIATVNTSTGVMTVPITSGGTGANSASAARTNLGLGALATLNTVAAAQVAAGSLTPDRLASGTPNYLLGYDATGAPAVVARSADIPTSQRVAQVAGGAFKLSVFRMVDGSIRAVGAGDHGANGDRSKSNVSFAERIAFSERPTSSVVDVVVNGNSGYALTSGGMVYSWGDNQHGQLGIDSTDDQHVAQPIEYFRTNGIVVTKIIQVRTGGVLPRAAFFLTSLGHVYACGRNNDGEVGNNSTALQKTPVRCGTISGITSVSVSAFPHHVLALKSTGAVYGWGDNSTGALGIGTTADVTSPTQLTGLSGVISSIVSVGGTATDGSSGIGSSFAVKNDGSLWSAGNNTFGQLGLGDTTQRTSWTEVIALSRPVLQLAASEGRPITVAARIDGLSGNEGWIWGYNGNGQCGTNNTTNQNDPYKPAESWQNSVTGVAVGGSAGNPGVIFRAGNELYAAGYNGGSNLGVGDAETSKKTFTRVLVPPEITISSWGARGAQGQWGIWILTSDGRAEMCGDNTNGQLGIREDTIRDMPIFNPARF
mgnify:CR=1 FL=1